MSPRPEALLVLASILGASPAASLDPGKAPTQYVLETWGTDQGLPQNSVRSLVQSRDGHLWFGTQEGLVRFDGVRFTVFDSGNAPGLAGKGINSIAEDAQGTLWVATDKGLSRLRDGRFETVPLDEGLARLPQPGALRHDVYSVVAGRGGDRWLAVPGGLLRSRDGHSEPSGPRDGLPGAFASICREGRDGSLWVGTRKGLARLRDGAWTTWTRRDGLPSDLVTNLAEDPDGSLWVATAGGLAHLRDGRFTTWTARDGLPGSRVQAVAVDGERNVWIGMAPGGLSRLSGGRLEHLGVREGLSDGTIESLLVDREGSLWIGTLNGGLDRLRDGKLTPIGAREGLSHEFTSSIVEDAEGNVWVGTPDGLNRLRNGRVVEVLRGSGRPTDAISCLSRARGGGIWVGTRGEGIRLLRGGRTRRLTTRDGLATDAVRGLLEDREGVLWVAGEGGLSRVSGSGVSRLTVADGLPNPVALSLAESPDGTLWAGTSGGLARIREGSLAPLPPRHRLDGTSLFELFAGRDGTLWIGTWDEGLSWIRGDRLATVTPRQGLFNSSVFRILDDGLGNLWMSANTGIFRVSQAELEAFAAGKVAAVVSTPFGVEDGMRSPECNRGGGTRTSDGRLWFSTIRGVVWVDPARIAKNTIPPPVLLQEVVADGARRPLPVPGELSLPAGTESLELHYTATSLRLPARVRFRYRLEGNEGEWVEAGTRRTAYFTNLAPGRYTFHVTACNDDGVWNVAGARLSFVLLPRPWQTGWFRALEVVAALATVGLVLVAQRRRLDRRRVAELRLADHRRKTEELEYARKVQMALLPQKPWRSGPFEVAGESRTATEVGGDTFGYFPTAPGRFVVVIGDATGHGVTAGLVTGMAKAVLASLRRSARTGRPEEWMEELNAALKESITQRGLGLCLGLAHVDEESSRVGLAVAGVPHAFRWRAAGELLERLELSGPPLGYLTRVTPATTALELAPGDCLVLLTDGLVEQERPGGDPWGYEGIEAALRPLLSRGLSPLETARALLDACEAFASGEPLADDRTVVVLSRLGPEPGPGA